MKNKDRIFVFVYGSLKRGYDLDHYLVGQHYIGNASTDCIFRLFDLGSYPGMVRVAIDGVSVKGELYSIDQDCLRQLDEVEGVDHGYYRREAIPLQNPFTTITVFAYLFLQSVDGLSDCGSEWPGETN